MLIADAALHAGKSVVWIDTTQVGWLFMAKSRP